MNNGILIPDIFNRILYFLDIRDILGVMQVCLPLKDIVDHTWPYLCKARFRCVQWVDPKTEFIRRNFAEHSFCSVCHSNPAYLDTKERGLKLCFDCYSKEIISFPDAREKYKISNEELAAIPSWERKHEHLGNISYCLKSDIKTYLSSKGQAKKASWRKELFERLQGSMDVNKAKHLAMHAMPADGTTLDDIAKHYIEQEKAKEESDRLLELQHALSRVNVSMSDIPPIYSPLIQAYIHGKKTIYTMDELVSLLGASNKHRNFNAALAFAETNKANLPANT
eukprot:Phypoly_transcript_15157.p1 GENE.Phypoly_transcript_15157~~Phypoly_transcript_15157.p1  ORF type:complete len:281 (+),score=29.66 Phypoly_transcript_15157:57-899(+)